MNAGMGHVYARVNGQWVECQSEYYYVFHSRSEKEIRFASEEIKALNRMHDSASSIYGKRLAEFLERGMTTWLFKMEAQPVKPFSKRHSEMLRRRNVTESGRIWKFIVSVTRSGWF